MRHDIGRVSLQTTRSRLGLVAGLLLAVGLLSSPEKAFAQAGTCGGVSGFPVNPSTGATLCSFTNPIVFFAPHPDDETLGMAGAILAAKAAGRTVIVELMTHGEGSGNCSIFPTTTDCGNARVNEFTESMIRLGVDGVVGGKDGGNNFGDKYLLYSNGSPTPSQGANQSYCSAPNLTPNPNVTARVNFWLAHGGSGLSLRGASGVDDYDCHPDHFAVALALKNAGFPDTKYYQVYRVRDPNRNNATSTNWSGQTVNLVRENTNPYCGTPGATDCSYASNRGSGKRGGLSAYNITCTSSGFYAYAWQYSTGDLFDGYDGDCASGNAAEYVDAPTGGGWCGEASCVPAQASYISHFTGAGCSGTESYYLPYDGYAYQCRPWDGAGQCGTIQRTVTNRSYRYNGTCYDAWPSGNTLSQFVTVYRCGEASCVLPQGAYISHFTGAGCTGTESYYLPYSGYAYQCQPWDGGGQCGTIQRTVTNRSYRYNGTCYDAWPSGNTLSQFVTVYR